MKKLKKCRMGIVFLLTALLAIPMNVGATTVTDTDTTSTTGSSMTITVGTTDSASAGDTVTLRLVGSNNPGISTLGLQLGYNDDYLSYTGAATWSDTIADNGLQMVTAATVDGSPVVNISAVFENTYSANETMVTLSFTVKRDYDDMSTYLSPTVREVTDSSLADVNVNWVYDSSAGLAADNSQNLVPDDDTSSGGTTDGDTSTGDDTTSSGGTTDDGTTGSDDGDDDDDTASTGGTTASSGNTSGGSGLTTTTTADGTVKKSVDNTPSTGAVDLTLVLGIVIALFVGVSGISLYVLKKKNTAN